MCSRATPWRLRALVGIPLTDPNCTPPCLGTKSHSLSFLLCSPSLSPLHFSSIRRRRHRHGGDGGRSRGRRPALLVDLSAKGLCRHAVAGVNNSILALPCCLSRTVLHLHMYPFHVDGGGEAGTPCSIALSLIREMYSHECRRYDTAARNETVREPAVDIIGQR